MEFHVEDDPDPRDIEVLETQIRREAFAAKGIGDEVELAIFVRDGGEIVAGISGWTWGDCCELQSLWVAPRLRGYWLGTRLLAAAEAEAAARGCTQTIHFTYDFQARPLYERAGYELVGRVEDFPSGTGRSLVSQAPSPTADSTSARRGRVIRAFSVETVTQSANRRSPRVNRGRRAYGHPMVRNTARRTSAEAAPCVRGRARSKGKHGHSGPRRVRELGPPHDVGGQDDGFAQSRPTYIAPRCASALTDERRIREEAGGFEEHRGTGTPPGAE